MKTVFLLFLVVLFATTQSIASDANRWGRTTGTVRNNK
jgi:hypothetical protein